VSIDYAEVYRLAKKGRRAEQRGKFMQGCVTAIVTSVLRALLGGWLLMLAIGIAHHDWLPQLPTIGYWPAVLIYAVLPSFGGSSKKNDD
jgi:drug/metabolite transporter (DMT)-like permease